jgi:hypothetical protein
MLRHAMERYGYMNERVTFIARFLQRDESFAALCERAGVSRKTGYKWVDRYERGGVTALDDRSRAPLSHSHGVASTIVDLIVALLPAMRPQSAATSNAIWWMRSRPARRVRANRRP